MVYSDAQRRFAFTVPDGYEQAQSSSSVTAAVFQSRSVSGGFVVNLQALESGVTLDLKMKATQAAISLLPDFQALTPTPVETTFAGRPARQFEFLYTESGKRYQSLTVSFVDGSAFYTLGIQIEQADYAMEIGRARTFLDTFRLLA